MQATAGRLSIWVLNRKVLHRDNEALKFLKSRQNPDSVHIHLCHSCAASQSSFCPSADVGRLIAAALSHSSRCTWPPPCMEKESQCVGRNTAHLCVAAAGHNPEHTPGPQRPPKAPVRATCTQVAQNSLRVLNGLHVQEAGRRFGRHRYSAPPRSPADSTTPSSLSFRD